MSRAPGLEEVRVLGESLELDPGLEEAFWDRDPAVAVIWGTAVRECPNNFSSDTLRRLQGQLVPGREEGKHSMTKI